MNHQLDYLKPIYNGTVGRAICGELVSLVAVSKVSPIVDMAREEFPVDCPICIALAPLNTCKTVR